MENNAPSSIQNTSTSLMLELDSLPPLSSNHCIYRVPKRLRCVNEKAYTPQIVSIGPLHHGDKSLEAMEEHKMRLLRDYLKRTRVGLDTYMKIIKDKERELRSCYAESIEFSSDEFVKIILVDAAFIIELLLRDNNIKGEPDYIFDRPWMIVDIIPDLLLLENQVPFFILEELFDQERIYVHGESLSITKLSRNFFKDSLNFEGINDNLELFSSSRVEHFVDLLRKFCVFPLKPKSEMQLKTFNLPSLTELHRAGVNFKVSTSKNLLDIQFSKGILEIPKQSIDDHTELTMRNLVAFEQCHYTERHITGYAVLMNCLVNTPEDVDLLVKYGIIDNQVGDCSQVATMINNLGDGAFLKSNNFYFSEIFEQLCDFCRTPWHRRKANLKQNYFHSPWAGLSVIAAVFIIILTFIQTVCSIISTLKDSPPHY